MSRDLRTCKRRYEFVSLPAPQLALPVRPPRNGRRSVSYAYDPLGREVVRKLEDEYGVIESRVAKPEGAPAGDAESAFDWCWLRASALPLASPGGPVVRIADMFAGCGQMSLGVIEACRALGRRGEVTYALDSDLRAREMCRRLFPTATVAASPIESIVGARLGAPVRGYERTLTSVLRDVDIVVGGPPCQGHSDLNNHTRRHDRRNSLGFRLVRVVELVAPEHVLVENVRGIVHDRGNVFQRMRDALDRLGYRTAVGVVRAEDVGVAQTRRRMFLVATRNRSADPAAALEQPHREVPRSFEWACGDLLDADTDDAPPHDRAPEPTRQNQQRIEHLFRKGLHELPDARRPTCHRDGDHSYKSIYGRLWWDRPAQTITTGFRCMGQGRYVHPTRQRTITPHEAARLQFIPDFVDFSELPATAVARLIGNAVPPKMAYAILVNLIAPSSLRDRIRRRPRT